jgi:hypothetical protein
MARTEQEKKEIYSKWKKLINMSQQSLDSWAKDDDRLLASINRSEAKSEGGIQSGYDSFHRIKRRKSKPMEKWTAQDFDNASQEIGFNSRMLGGKPGKPIGESNMSKWEISLKNWGHDPSLKSSPAHAKWKAWKKSQKRASISRVASQAEREALLKAAKRIRSKRRVTAGRILEDSAREKARLYAEAKEKEAIFFKIFASYLTEKLKKAGGELVRYKEIIQWGVREGLIKTQDFLKEPLNLKYPIAKTVHESIFWKASQKLGLADFLDDLRRVYVEDTLESFDGLVKISSETTLYDDILDSITFAEGEFDKIPQLRKDLNEALEIIKEDMKNEKAWYKSDTQKAKEWLQNRAKYLANRFKYSPVAWNAINKFLIKDVYHKAMVYISDLEDAKMYGVKLLVVAGKAALIPVIGAILGFFFGGFTLPALLPLGKSMLATSATSLKYLLAQIAGVWLLTGEARIAASSVRKLGIVMGVTVAHLVSMTLKIKDFAVYLYKKAGDLWDWLSDTKLVKYLSGWTSQIGDFISNRIRTASLIEIRQEMERDPVFRRKVLAGYQQELQAIL